MSQAVVLMYLKMLHYYYSSSFIATNNDSYRGTNLGVKASTVDAARAPARRNFPQFMTPAIQQCKEKL